MTDKQIIIKRIRDCDNCRFRPETSKVCEIYDNCYLVREHICNLREQLRTKEQECERTKERLESFQKDYSKLYQVVENKGYIKELDQLKAENKHLNDLLNQALKELEQSREAIEKIKEIAYELTNEEYTDFIEGKQKQILQICDEVLSE